MFEKKISKDEINLLPLLKFKGEIIVIRNYDEVRDAVKILSKETLLGFDTEKKPTFLKGQYHPPALIQLATEEVVYLFQILDGIESSLVKLLANENIKKIGVAVRDDIKDLQKVEPFRAGGFIDLNTVAAQLEFENIGLRNLSALVLNHRVAKGEQRSDWSREKLSDGQKMYAAVDAWASLMIYKKLEKWGYID